MGLFFEIILGILDHKVQRLSNVECRGRIYSDTSYNLLGDVNSSNQICFRYNK
jgi:hypothetical protein